MARVHPGPEGTTFFPVGFTSPEPPPPLRLFAAPSPANGCTSIADDPTLYPTQELLVRDGENNALILRQRAARRARRISGVLTISHTEPVPNGTRLADLTFLGPCATSENVTYDKYRGVVE